jgi:hypothetical protein
MELTLRPGRHEIIESQDQVHQWRAARLARLGIFVIGAVEALSLLPQEIHGLSRTTGFWGFISRFNINAARFVIVGLFLGTWLAALLIWRYAHIEQMEPSPPVWHTRWRRVPRDQPDRH